MFFTSSNNRNDQTKNIFSHFFKLQKGNSTIYLLGTNHMILLEDIPKWALAIIKDQLEKSERVFVEAVPPKKTLQQLKNEGFFEQESEDIGWLEKLSTAQKEKVLGIIELIKIRHNIDFEAQDLCIAGVCALVMKDLYESGMDYQLQTLSEPNKLISVNSEALHDWSEEEHLSQREYPDTIETLKDFLDMLFFNEDSAAQLSEARQNYFSSQVVPSFEKSEIIEISRKNRVWKKAVTQCLEKFSENISVFMAVGHAHLYDLSERSFGLLTSFEQDGFHKQSLSITDSITDAFVSYEDTPSRAAHSPRKK